MVVQHLQIGVITLWRQEERAIDQRVLVEHRELATAHNAGGVGDVVRTQIRKHKTARFVISVWT